MMGGRQSHLQSVPVWFGTGQPGARHKPLQTVYAECTRLQGKGFRPRPHTPSAANSWASHEVFLETVEELNMPVKVDGQTNVWGRSIVRMLHEDLQGGGNKSGKVAGLTGEGRRSLLRPSGPSSPVHSVSDFNRTKCRLPIV